ncbi:hypothetical protein LTS10_002448 [Elasticomyces elasticus]|nr:hypothetical protein LTS10_002448 [Elasticomyces elasticus]
MPSADDDVSTEIYCMLREGEGSYKSWLRDIAIVLKKHGAIKGNCKDAKALLNRLRGLHGAASLRARETIMQSVSGSILARIPDADHKSATKLLARLEVAARPFRFMDLPTELREYFYEHYILALDVEYSGIGNIVVRHNERNLEIFRPNLLLASPQLNAEATAILLMRTKFHLVFARLQADWPQPRPLDTPEFGIFGPAPFPAIQAIRRWEAEVVQQDARFLRWVSVKYDGDDASKAYVITFSPATELKVKLPSGLTEEQRGRHEQRVAEIEAERKALGLQGEAVMKVLTQKSDFRKQAD